ncbi:hypothetical protein [Paraburkholderia sp. Ac-20347]|nr:hypothetical protein [Paraburkholderia sp. Ac-20347]MBN3809107.1 hypothetical protein [Paraburkholderia sp. Ac-20347]
MAIAREAGMKESLTVARETLHGSVFRIGNQENSPARGFPMRVEVSFAFP